MVEISGLLREIDAVQGSILAIECVLAALRRLPKQATREQFEMEILCDAVRISARSSLPSATREAFDREIARLLDALIPVEA